MIENARKRAASNSPKPTIEKIGGGNITRTTTRLAATVASLAAARRMEEYLEVNGIGQTEFAIRVGTTDRTLRRFRKSGKIRRSIFEVIAAQLGVSREELLKPKA